MTPDQLTALVRHHRAAAVAADEAGLFDLGAALHNVASTYESIFEPTPEEVLHAELMLAAQHLGRLNEAGRYNVSEWPERPTERGLRRWAERHGVIGRWPGKDGAEGGFIRARLEDDGRVLLVDHTGEMLFEVEPK